MMEKILTLEDAKIIHKKMWEYVKNHYNDCDYAYLSNHVKRYELKKDFCNEHKLELTNNCILCEYALQQCIKNGVSETYMCHYCPAIWGTERNLKNYFCDTLNSDVLCWQFGNLDDIINIKWKDEEE